MTRTSQAATARPSCSTATGTRSSGLPGRAAMSKKLVAFDDLTGAEADSTHYIGIDGTWYELDLTSEHFAEMERDIERYIRAGRKFTGDVKSARLSEAG